jgi:hypothetical protein
MQSSFMSLPLDGGGEVGVAVYPATRSPPLT